MCRAAPKTAAKRDAIVSKALPMEVALLADEGAFIGGVALTMTAITLLVSNWLQHSSCISNSQQQQLQGVTRIRTEAASKGSCLEKS